VTELADALESAAHSRRKGSLSFVRYVLRLRSYCKIYRIRIVRSDIAWAGSCPYHFPIE
jgi:hypothetical protein